ncbi:hypothetical protein ACFLYO_05960 [Chloroflexota bacterium]
MVDQLSAVPVFEQAYLVEAPNTDIPYTGESAPVAQPDTRTAGPRRHTPAGRPPRKNIKTKVYGWCHAEAEPVPLLSEPVGNGKKLREFLIAYYLDEQEEPSPATWQPLTPILRAWTRWTRSKNA